MTDLFDNKNNKLWVAEENRKIVGSICIIDKGNGTAQLRLFGTHPSVQGKGVGKALMQTAMEYCNDMNYKYIFLWTIDICKAALHLYETFGFKCSETKPNDTCANYHMTEEKWECFLK